MQFFRIPKSIISEKKSLNTNEIVDITFDLPDSTMVIDGELVAPNGDCHINVDNLIITARGRTCTKNLNIVAKNNVHLYGADSGSGDLKIKAGGVIAFHSPAEIGNWFLHRIQINASQGHGIDSDVPGHVQRSVLLAEETLAQVRMTP